MKTQGMPHQLEALRRSDGRAGYALFMEQGTGKTWTALAEAERLYERDAIGAVLVIAPKGVHTNWTRREIPEHLSVPHVAYAWRSGAGKRERAELEKLFRPWEEDGRRPLRILAINIDAIMTADAFAFVQRFLRATRALLIVDESSRIKNPDTKRTLRVSRLRPLVEWVRIATGTPITNSPGDIFPQLELLESGLLGTTSYRAFVAEYAELVDFKDVTDENFYRNSQMLKKNPRLAFAQVVQRNPDGSPRWRNLEKLQRLIAPHSYRVLKRECLALPEKIYTQTFFELSPKQHAAYRLMEEECRVLLEDNTVLPVKQLAALMKLQQITSGYVILPNAAGVHYVSEDNPRLEALLTTLEDRPGKAIVWARFQEELDALARELRGAGRKVVQYHGRVKAKDRDLAVDQFQDGDADIFLGQPRSGGIGLTLTAAETVVYYSNDFNMETRVQSEDRAHRIGTRRNVVYIDMVAENTIDEAITRALQRKTDMAAEILGDRKLDVRNSFSSDTVLALGRLEN